MIPPSKDISSTLNPTSPPTVKESNAARTHPQHTGSNANPNSNRRIPAKVNLPQK